MQNVSEDQIKTLNEEISSFFGSINRMVDWANRNLKHEEREEFILHIKNKRRVVRKTRI